MIKRCLLLLLLLGLLLFLLFGFFLNLYVFPTIITLTYSNVTPLLVMDEFMDDYLHQLYYPLPRSCSDLCNTGGMGYLLPTFKVGKLSPM